MINAHNHLGRWGDELSASIARYDHASPGSWMIDGAALDTRLLPGLYRDNAVRLLRLTD